jgi:hypothetical protein
MQEILISDYWIAAWNFASDALDVQPLRDYLAMTTECFHEGECCQFVVLSIHPTEAGAREEGEAWQSVRDKWPLPPLQRLERLRPQIEGLEIEHRNWNYNDTSKAGWNRRPHQ